MGSYLYDIFVFKGDPVVTKKYCFGGNDKKWRTWMKHKYKKYP